jgi:tetratricopeptide (TPR) repeat protein
VLGLLLVAWSYFHTRSQLTLHRADTAYRQFVQARDQALVYGFLAPDEEAIFLGGDAVANRHTAIAAVEEALKIAGVGPGFQESDVARNLPAARRTEIVLDCYGLLLLLARIHSQEALTERQGSEEYQESLRTLDHARKLGIESRAYYVQRAQILEQLGAPEEARQNNAQAAALAPESALDYFLLGETQYRSGKWSQAMQLFELALSKQPSQFWAQFFLAICQLKLQKWEAARAGLNACLSQQPEFVWGYLFRSFANEQLHASQEAERDFQKALELNPGEDARYVVFLTRGIHYFHQQQLERATEDFRAAAGLRPKHYHAYLNLAQVCLARGDLTAAAEFAQTAQQLAAPVEAVAGYHLQRSSCLLRLKRTREALQACQAALQLSPEQPRAYEVQGRVLLALEEYAQAEKAFDGYFRNRGEPQADAFRGRGLARMKLGKYPEAADDYDQAIRLSPDADLYVHRGWAYFFTDAWRLAQRDFDKAIKLDSSAVDAYIGRGLARVLLGDYRQAVADGELAWQHGPKSPEMMHNLACIFAEGAVRAAADLREIDRRTLAGKYRTRACEAVERTLGMLRPDERLSFWRDKILPDAMLKSIQNAAEFKRLQDKTILRQDR